MPSTVFCFLGPRTELKVLMTASYYFDVSKGSRSDFAMSQMEVRHCEMSEPKWRKIYILRKSSESEPVSLNFREQIREEKVLNRI